MTSRTKSISRKLLVFLLCLMTVASYSLPTGFGVQGGFGVEESHAANIPSGGTMTITGNDEDGAVPESKTSVRFIGSSQTTSPFDYTFQVALTGLSQVDGRKVRIEVARGLQLSVDGTADGNVVNAAESITKGNFPAEQSYNGIANYTFNPNTFNGSNQQYVEVTLKGGQTSYTHPFTVRTVVGFAFTDIKDAIKVTYTEPGKTPVVLKKDATIQQNGYWYNGSETSDSWDITKAAADGATVRIGETDGNGMSAQLRQTSRNEAFGNVRYEYICPPGVTLSKDPRSNLTTGDCYGNLTSQNLAGGGKKYTIASQVPLVTGYFDSVEPILYTVNYPAGQSSLKVTGTKTALSLDGKNTVFSTLAFSRTFKKPTSGGADIFVQYRNMTDYLDSGRKAGKYDSPWKPARVGDSGYATNLGCVAVGNAGDRASNPLTIEILYNNNIKAYWAVIPVVGQNETGNIWVRTNKRAWYNTNIKKKGGSDESVSSMISWKELGFDYGQEWITGVRYDIGSIPANTNLVSYQGAGGITTLERGESGDIGTLEAYETSDRTKTTGRGIMSTTIQNADVRVYNDVNVGIDAGQTKNMGLFRTWVMGARDVAGDPTAIYICVPKGGRISNFKIVAHGNGSAGDFDLTGYIRPQDVSTKRVSSKDGTEYYKINLTTLPAEHRVFGENMAIPHKGWTGECQYYFTYDLTVPQGAEAKDYPYGELVYLEIADTADTNKLVGFDYSDPRGFGTGKNGIRGVYSNNFLRVTAIADVIAESKAKNNEMSNYIVYDSAVKSTVLPIGNGDDDVVNLRTTVTNKSGVKANPKTTVWIPIPRKGDNWGPLTAGCVGTNSQPTNSVPFTLNLQGTVTNPDPNVWDLYYGENITPPSDGKYPFDMNDPSKSWDTSGSNSANKWKSSTTNYSNVNCIKLVAKTEIPAFKSGTTPYSIDIDANVKVAAADKNQKNSIDVMRPLVFRDLTTPTGAEYSNIGPGEPTAMTIARGKIQGEMFIDADRDGTKTAGEIVINEPYKVTLYGKNGNRWTQLKQTTIKEYGGKYRYQFNGLATGADYKDYYRIEVTSPTTGVTKKFRQATATAPATADEYIVTDKTNTNGKGVGNAFTHAGGASSNAEKLGYAEVNSIDPYEADDFTFTPSNGGHYNLGVYDGSLKTSYVFKSDATMGTMTSKDTNAAIEKDLSNSSTQMKYTGGGSDKLTWPQVNAENGYIFRGWQEEGTTTVVTQPTAAQLMGAKNKTYEAQFNVREYNVNFETNGGNPSSIKAIKVKTNEVIKGSSFPADPTKTGQYFKGWKVKATVGSLNQGDYITDTSLMPPGNITLVADWTPAGIVEDGIAISAGDFRLTEAQARSLTINGAISLANASAWVAADPNTGVGISATKSDISKIKAEPGTYDVEFVSNEYNGKTAAKTVKATVYTKIEPGEVTLAANDFSYNSVKADGSANAALTANNIKSMSSLVSEGLAVSQVNINTTQMNALNQAISQKKKGTYPITFTATKNGKTTTLQITVTLRAPELTVSKALADSTKKYRPEELVAFVTTVTNTGNMDAANYRVADTPVGMTFKALQSPASGVTVNTASGVTNFTIANIPAGGAVELKYTMQVNTAAVTANNSAQLKDPSNINIGNASKADVPIDASGYIVKYDTDGGTAVANKTVAWTQKNLTSGVTTTKAGYNFDAWYTEAGIKYNNQGYNELADDINDKSITLKAKWIPKTFTVNYNTNGGSTISARTGVKWDDDNLAPKKDPVRAGYDFEGWYTNSGLTTSYYDGAYSSLVANDTVTSATLYAKWTQKTYTVKYDTDGGSAVANKTGVKWADTGLAPATAPTRAGYTFDAWYTEAGAKYSNQAYSALAEDDSVKSITLKAKWNAKATYTVKYNTNGGTAVADKTGVKWDDGNFAPKADPRKTGSTFEGWFTDSGLTKAYSGEAYSTLVANDTVTTATLYAKWTVNSTYFVKYDVDGGTPAVANKTGVKWADTGLAPTTTVTRAGYTLDGWYTEAGKKYNNESYGTLAVDDSVKSVTLKAKWNAKTNYTVKYNMDGGTPAVADKTGVKWEDGNFAPKVDPKKSGFTFAGWFTDSGKTKAYSDGAYSSLVADDTVTTATLYAKWIEGTSYTVKYDVDGGSAVANKTGLKWSSTGLASGATTTRAGYTFDGWFTEAGAKYNNESYGALAGDDKVMSITLKAKWTAKTYTVNYNVDGGSAVAAKTGVKWDQDNLAPKKDPVKAGFTFEGWFTDSGKTKLYTDAAYSSIAANDTTASITLYAKWTAKNYIVKYDADGGSAVANKTNVKWTDTGLANGATTTKAGYTFDGWYVEAGAKYNNQAYSALADDDSVKSITLKARWTAKTYTVNYNVDGGSSVAAKTGVKWNDENLAPKDNPTKAGSTFAGWFTDSGKTKAYTGGAYSSIAANDATASITLYAKWTAKNYIVKYDVNGGTPAVANKTGVKWADTGLAPATTVTRTGFTFDGWYTEAGAKYANQAYSALADDDNDSSITLTAKWTAKTYTVKYNTGGGDAVADRTGVKWDDENLAPKKDPKRTGYLFEGWYTDSAKKVPYNDGPYSSLVANDGVASATLYANWEPVRFTVVFEKNTMDTTKDALRTPVTGDMDEVDVYYDDKTKAAENAYKAAGYYFRGWNTKKDGSGTAVADKGDISRLATEQGKTVKLYAQWEVRYYTVKYNTNNGQNFGHGALKVTPATYPDKTKVRWTDADLAPANDPTEDHSVFGGWYIDNKTFTRKYDGGAYSTLVANDNVETATLHAKWIEITYKTVVEGKDTITPKPAFDRGNRPKRGNEFMDDQNMDYVIKNVSAPDPITGIVIVTVKLITYPVVVKDSNPEERITLKDPASVGKTTKPGDEVDDANDVLYVVNNMAAKADPDTGEKKVEVVKVSWAAEDKNGKAIVATPALNKPKADDIFTDDEGDLWKVVSVDKPDINTGIAKVVAELVPYSYDFIEGAGQTWTKASAVTGDFMVKRSSNDAATFRRFVEVKIDGQKLDEAQYTKASGSVKIALNVDYMESLSIGGHSIEIVFKDGSAKSEFTVKKNTVNTGFSGTMLSGTAKSKNSVSLKWAKVKNASKYVVYGTKCNSKGNVYKYKKIKTLSAKNTKYVVKKINGKKLKKGTYYKFYVQAYDKYGNLLTKSRNVHVATKGGKYGNYKSVKLIKPKKAKLSLYAGKTYKVKAKEVRGSKKVDRHVKIAYDSSNKKVATVTRSGKIKAKSKGTCNIYAYAQNGVYKKIKLTVR